MNDMAFALANADLSGGDFVVLAPDGKTYRIWADGRIEGFGDGAIILNRIPALIAREVVASRQAA